MARISEQVEWLSLVDISGPFLAASVLEEVFPQGLDKVETPRRQRLRAAYDEWRDAVDEDDPELDDLHAVWTCMVIQEALEYEDEVLAPRERLDGKLVYRTPEHGVEMAPDFAVRGDDGRPRLLIAIHPPETDLEKPLTGDRWPASPAERMTLLCRANDVRIGLITNGEQWMLVNAPTGSTSGCATWLARLWWLEPVTFKAFVSLLGVRRCFGAEDERLDRLLEKSIAFQEEVTDTLGEQVRRTVEVLIQALGRADQDRNGELLKDVGPAELYEAGLTVMMRLVFILCAEERRLLLLGDPVYDQYYAISTLRAGLREEESLHGPEVLERRHDAWSRMLAVFRAVYGGVEHETLRMPALGGSLFDPDRFPFLEGRAKGTSWREEAASPLPIDNRTVLLLLTALQVLEQRSGAQLLSYRALDVEQVGHVYEGLLEYTVARLPEVAVGLIGSQKVRHPTIGLGELESLHARGTEVATDHLAELTGRSATAIQNALKRGGNDDALIKLVQACGGDETLARRLLPFAELIRTDSWGHLLVYRAGSFAVTRGADRRETGTHYTPRSLTETIVEKTLEPVVYVGPAEGKPREEWRLKTPAELLDLKICDPAMGSGAFLVQVCRYLTERLVEAWAREEDAGRVLTVDGVVYEDADDHELLPKGLDDRLLIARRLIAERCLYGVDLNPLAVELAKLSIWLVTMAKGRPFGFLDHNLRPGDSLLGIHRLDQLTTLTMNPDEAGLPQRLFGQNIGKWVNEAVAIRSQLRAIPIRDIRDVEAMARLNLEARKRLEAVELVADAFIAAVFAVENPHALEGRLAGLAIQGDQAVQGDADARRRLIAQAERELAKDTRDGRSRRPFHWPLEFPEVFQRETGGFDAMIGNPPFMAGKRLTTRLGEAYTFGIKRIVSDAKGAADLCAYFFLIAVRSVKSGGAFGMIATNSISQGATREVGLAAIEKRGCRIIRAWPDLQWPGGAAVTISPCVIFNGVWKGSFELCDRPVCGISSYLEEDESGIQPQPLRSNDGIASTGTGINGEGFIIEKELYGRMIEADPRNSVVIRRYLTSQDINQTPDSTPTRYVIDFGDMPEAVARTYRLPFDRVTELVKPQRDKLTRQIHETCYWKHWDRREAFYERIRLLHRVIVCGRVSKHHVFAFADPGWLFADGVVVFSRDDVPSFAVLQSSTHAEWVQRHKTTMRLDTTYSVSRCFLTFPWPEQLGRDLAHAGQAYLQVRRQVQLQTKSGLTAVYNHFHDPEDTSSEITGLREAHRNLDQVVASAYGMRHDLEHDFHETKQGVRYAVSARARRGIIACLLELNRRNYEGQAAQGLLGGVTNSRSARRLS